ncbi:hypothetical protein EB796_015714 [Bugula neritina]|uniref:Uncharacterized protein n=1 Tax=Bugula neritina TaxID=10212 RepID=A0A7J7JIQ1_BUGNE|nr:hypothetical protein EB796_015714 [Bugula neritina]
MISQSERWNLIDFDWLTITNHNNIELIIQCGDKERRRTYSITVASRTIAQIRYVWLGIAHKVSLLTIGLKSTKNGQPRCWASKSNV